MANLGSLWYTMGIKFDDSTLTAINKRLEKEGVAVKVTPELLKPITDIIPKWVNVDITPNQVEQAKLDAAVAGKVMHAEILPLADKLKTAVVDTLKDLQIPLNGLTVPPGAISTAVSNALSSANFTSVGDRAGEELAKAIRVKVEGQRYDATVTAKTDKLTDMVTKALDKVFEKEKKVKLDRSDIRAFRDELRNKIGEAVKVTPTLNVTQEALQKAVEGKVMRVEIVPLVSKLRDAIKNTFNGSTPPEIEVGVQANKLRNLISTVLLRQGYMVNVNTVTGLEKSVTTQLNGRVYNVRIRANATEIANSVQASLMQVQSRAFGLKVSKDILRDSIDTALMGKPFNIQIAVMHDQARRAVQNALNNARMVGKDDALAYQRLQTGELRAAQAELARLKAAQHGAASAANTHASASLNLGGAMGSNIKIAGELGAAMASLYSIHAAKQFLSQVIEIGGELEHQKIALETIYGTESKMESLYGQIKSLARNSPFGVMELTKNVKQLSAYGVAYNEVYDTAKRLADISAATSVDISRLILAFGKTKNRTFLDGLEAKQFAYANIPIYDMLSKKLTELEGKFVSVKDVMGRIKKREIGFDMVKDILWDMTDEGGEFYNMQEKLAGSVKTSWKLVKDNIELMFGELAESPIGDWLKWTAERLQGATREWKTLGWAIASGAVVLGVYKVAMLGVNTAMGKDIVTSLTSVAAKRRLHEANLQAAVSYRTLTTEESNNLFAARAANKLTGIRILSRKKLTAEEVNALYATKNLTKEQLLKLVALKRVSAAEAENILITKQMRAATDAETVAKVKNIQAEIARANAVKRGSVIWAQMVASIKSTGMALLSFSKMALPFAAIGIAVGAFTKWRENIQKAKDATDVFIKKGRDGFEDLIKKVNELNFLDVSKLSAPQLANYIEDMKTTLKDYSLTAQETFDKVFSSDNNGKVRSQKEQFEMLRDAVNETAEAYRNMKNGEKSAIFQSDKVKAVDKASKKAGDDAIETSDAYTNLLKYSNLLDDIFEKIQINRNKKGQFLDIDKQATSELQDQLQLANSLDEKLKAVYVTVKEGGSVYYENDGIIQEAINKYISKLIQQKKSEEGVNEAIRQRLQELQNLHKAQNSAWNPTKSKRQAEEYLQEAKAFAEASEKMTSAQKEMFMDLAYESIGKLSPRIREMRENVEKMIKTMQVAPDQFGLTKELLEYVKLVDKLRSLPSDQQAEKVSFYEQLDPVKYVLLSDDVLNGAERYMTQIKNALIKNTEEKYPELSSTIHNLIESDEFTAFVQLKLQNGWQESFIQQFHNLEEWKQNLVAAAVPSNDIRDEFVKAISGAETVSDAAKGLRELYKTAGSVIQNEGAILLKIRPALDLSQPFNPHLFDSEDPLFKEAAYAVSNAINKKIAAENALNAYGLPFADPTKDKKKTPKGSQKDLFAEAIKERIKILKEAKKEYEDLAKLVGTDSAFEKLKDSPIFEGLKANQFLPKQTIPQTIEEYKKSLNELQEKLTAKGLKTKAHRELNIEIEKVKFEIEKKETEQTLKLAIDAVSKEAERQLADWNLFDKIRKATGNQDLAMSIAFGLNADAETDYPTLVKNQFNEVAKAAKSTLTFDTATPELLKAAPEEVQKAWEKAYSDIQKYRDKERDDIADMVSKYRNTQEEIVALTAEAEEKKRKIRENKDLSPAHKQQITDRIDADLNYQIFQKSGEYLKFFNAILSMTGKEAEDVGRKIKEALDKKLQAGTISAKDYCEEMEKIDKQLEKIRQKQKGFGGFGSFMKGGLSQMFKDQFEQAQSDYNKAVQDFDTAKQQFDLFSREGNEAGMQQAQSAMDAANSMKEGASSAMEGAQGAMQTVEMIDKIVHGINDTVQGIKGSFDLIADMADSLGIDTSADTDWGAAGAFLDAFSQASQHATDAWDSLKSGNIGGVIKGVIGSITSWFTTFNRWHDAKLQKQIERSQEVVDNIQRAYDAIERRMANFLGNGRNLRVLDAEQDIKNLEKLNQLSQQYWLYSVLTREEREKLTKRKGAYEIGGAFGYQRQLMTEQLAELEKQRQLELDKKKSDSSVVADYEDQIDEMKIQIRDFAIEVAKDLYGIDLNGWAEELGDTIVDACARGENALEAFDKKVGDIMRDVASKMISQDILAPMFGDLRDFLFGSDGMSGAFGADFKLDPSEMGAMKEYLDKIKNEGIPAAQDLFNAINEATGGMLNDTEKSKSGMTAGLQSLTENTGDLLASYFNAFRGDAAAMRGYMETYLNTLLPQMNIIAESQLQAQRQIAENTLRNAIAAEMIVKYSKSIDDRLRRAQADKSTGFYLR